MMRSTHLLLVLAIGCVREPAAPPVRLVTAQTIRGFLAKQNVAANDAPDADAKAAVVRMICVRK